MRLSPADRDAIKLAVAEQVGADSRVWLFGSRVDDSKRGGDIDLLIETERVLPSRVEVLCKLEARLVRALGDRKIDILLKDPLTPDASIIRAALKQGILL